MVPKFVSAVDLKFVNIKRKKIHLSSKTINSNRIYVFSIRTF